MHLACLITLNHYQASPRWCLDARSSSRLASSSRRTCSRGPACDLSRNIGPGGMSQTSSSQCTGLNAAFCAISRGTGNSKRSTCDSCLDLRLCSLSRRRAELLLCDGGVKVTGGHGRQSKVGVMEFPLPARPPGCEKSRLSRKAAYHTDELP